MAYTKKNPKRVTSTDVATAAGVSQSTVSLVLNGKKTSSFAPETVRRVMEAAEQLGYHRLHSEKSLSLKATSNLIAVFCPVISNPYYTAVVQAIEQDAYEKGFRTIICTTYRNPKIEQAHLLEIEKCVPAGIIFTSIPLHVNIVESMSKHTPIVVIGDRNEHIDVDTIEVNSYRSGIATAKHLMELGHRNIAFISTTMNNQNVIRLKRMEGVRDALSQADNGSRLIVESLDITTVESNADSEIEHKVGGQLALKCIEDKDITAIVAVNDMVAYGAVDALKEAGYRIPEDYSICGFDNIFPSRLSGVQLTSVENFMLKKGENALDMLSKRIEEKQKHSKSSRNSITRVEYQPRLIIRSTTGTARQAQP